MDSRLTRRIAALFLLSMLVAACNGGGKGSPTQPPGTFQVAGHWNAVETLQGAAPLQICWAAFLDGLAGASGNYNVDVTQSGNMATVVVQAVNVQGDRSVFQGTVGTSSLSGPQTGGFADVTFTCSNGQDLAIHDLSGSISVSGTASHLAGTLTEVYEVTDQQTGMSLGQVTITYTFTMDR